MKLSKKLIQKCENTNYSNEATDKEISEQLLSGQTNCSDNSKVLRFIMHLLSYSFPKHFIRNP